MERMLKRIAVRKDGSISMSEFRNFAEKYQGEIDKLEEENKKLKEKIERLEKCFKKGGFNPQDVECLMEEDTLQELRDLGEI